MQGSTGAISPLAHKGPTLSPSPLWPISSLQSREERSTGAEGGLGCFLKREPRNGQIVREEAMCFSPPQGKGGRGKLADSPKGCPLPIGLPALPTPWPDKGAGSSRGCTHLSATSALSSERSRSPSRITSLRATWQAKGHIKRAGWLGPSERHPGPRLTSPCPGPQGSPPHTCGLPLQRCVWPPSAASPAVPSSPHPSWLGFR